MKAFYTIIKIAPNSAVGDTVSIGLLLFQNNKFWLKFSEEKKQISKRLINNNPETVDFVTKKISQQIKKLNGQFIQSEKEFFQINNVINFNYLSAYCNGVLQFSNPLLLNDIINPQKFEKLFELLIDNSHQPSKKGKDKISDTLYDAVDRMLIKKVNRQIHTNINITAKILPSMYFQYEMDCIGMNGTLVGAKLIPFDRTQVSLDKDISHYIALISLLSTHYKKDVTKNHFFVIADEPLSVKSPEHKTFVDIQKNPLFKVVPSTKIAEIAKDIKKSKAKRFLEIETDKLTEVKS
jgi:hypothetical protein